MGNTNSGMRDGGQARQAASDKARVDIEAQTHPIHPPSHVRQVQSGQQRRYVPGGGRLAISSNESMGHSPPESPSSAARSPLLFTPQIPTVPITKAGEFVMGSYYSGIWRGVQAQVKLAVSRAPCCLGISCCACPFLLIFHSALVLPVGLGL